MRFALRTWLEAHLHVAAETSTLAKTITCTCWCAQHAGSAAPKLSHKKKVEADADELGAGVGGGAGGGGKKRGKKEAKTDKLLKGARDVTTEGCHKAHKKKKMDVDVRGEEGVGGVEGDQAGGDAPSPFRKMTEGQRRMQEAMLAQFTKK